MTDASTDATGASVSEHPARRDFLFLMTGSVAAVGVAALAWPFIDQMNPDAETIAAAGPVDIDISQLQPGQRVVVLWSARPVFVVRRTPEALKELQNPKLTSQLRDPQFRHPSAADLCQKLASLTQGRIPRRRWNLHPSRLRAAVRAAAQRDHSHAGLAGGVFLPLPRFEIRSFRPRL